MRRSTPERSPATSAATPAHQRWPGRVRGAGRWLRRSLSEAVVATGEVTQRNQGGSLGPGEHFTRADAAQGLEQGFAGVPGEFLALGRRGGDQNGLDLAQHVRPGQHGRVTHQVQDTDRFHGTVSVFGCRQVNVGKGFPGGGHRVQRVGIAAEVPRGPVGADDFCDLEPVPVQVAGHACSIGVGAFNPEPHRFTVRQGELCQSRVACPVCQQLAGPCGQDRRVMGVRVRVHADADENRALICHDGSAFRSSAGATRAGRADKTLMGPLGQAQIRSCPPGQRAQDVLRRRVDRSIPRHPTQASHSAGHTQQRSTYIINVILIPIIAGRGLRATKSRPRRGTPEISLGTPTSLPSSRTFRPVPASQVALQPQPSAQVPYKNGHRPTTT